MFRGCGCICPECGEQVGSRIYSESSRKESCFFHYDQESTCSGSQSESELHLKAKSIFESNTQLLTPAYGNSTKKLEFTYSEVTLEKRIGKIRPDIILINESDEKLIVEVAVTSFIKPDSKKMKEIIRLKIPTVEIDLSDLYQKKFRTDKNIDTELKTILIDSSGQKKWIWNTPELVKKSFEEKEEGVSIGRIVIIGVAIAAGIRYFYKWILKLFINWINPKKRKKKRRRRY